MCPGTISGAKDPDDRLRQEGGPGRFPRPTASAEDTEPNREAELSPTAKGVLFMFAAMLGSLAAISVLARPMMDGVAALLSGMGIPVPGPSAYAVPGEWARAVRSSPPAYFVKLVAGEAIFLALAIGGAALIRAGGLRDRLGLVKPRGGWRVLALAVVIEVLVLVFGITAVLSFVRSDLKPPEGNLQLVEMLRSAPRGWWLAVLFATTVLPGVAEEILFRGLIQRQLLRWWRPAAAILCTGLVFAFAHPPLVRALMVMPGCIWLGYVAWRCGSVLPGIVLHAGTNAGIQLLIRWSREESPEPEPARWIIAAGALLSGGLCIWLLILLHRWTRPLPAANAPAGAAGDVEPAGST